MVPRRESRSNMAKEECVTGENAVVEAQAVRLRRPMVAAIEAMEEA